MLSRVRIACVASDKTKRARWKQVYAKDAARSSIAIYREN